MKRFIVDKNDWTKGLCVMSSNALKWHGFNSKKEVLSAMKNGQIYLRTDGRGSTVYQLGKVGIAEVRAWLKLPAIKSNSQRSIEKAKKILESNGFTVTPNA